MLNWLLVGYMWLFVHRPFEVWTWLGAFRLERVYMLCLIAVWLAGGAEKRQLGNIFTPAVFFFTFALTVSAMFGTYAVFFFFFYQDWLKYIVFYVILMTSVKTEKDLKIIVSGFIIVCFLFIGHSYREFLAGRTMFAAGSNRLVGVGVTFSEFNDYGTTLLCMLPLIMPLVTLCKKTWHYLFVLGYVLLTCWSVILTGSRGAFIMMVALLILPVLISRHRFILIPVMLVAAMVGWTVMPESMQDRYRTIWDPTISEQANANMRGRTQGFYNGLDNWMNNPLFGVGPGQHGVPLGAISGNGMPVQAHNLGGQVAGETGTLGVIAFLLMLSCFGINHISIWQNYKFLQEKNLGKEGLYLWRVSVAVMCAIFMVLLQGASLHNGWRFQWVWFGAFQALAVMMMQEKVDAVIKGKLLPK
jgi:hypothetical protein